jgi:hypothetical protein
MMDINEWYFAIDKRIIWIVYMGLRYINNSVIGIWFWYIRDRIKNNINR